MIAIIFGIMFFVAIHYYDKSQSELKQKERKKEKEKIDKVIQDSVSRANERKKEFTPDTFSNYKSDISSLKSEIIGVKRADSKLYKRSIEFENRLGQKFIIENDNALNYLEDIIESSCKSNTQLSGLGFINFFNKNGLFSINRGKQNLEFERLEAIEKSDMTDKQIYKFNLICFLQSHWEQIDEVDSGLEINLETIIKNYIMLKHL